MNSVSSGGHRLFKSRHISPILVVHNAHSFQTGGQSHRRDDANALELRINKYMTISTEIPSTALKGLGYQFQYSHVRVH